MTAKNDQLENALDTVNFSFYINYMNDLTEKHNVQVEIKSDVRKKFMTGVYLWMMLALVISAVVSTALVASPSARQAIIDSSGIFWGLLIAELVLVFVLSLAIHRISAGTAAALFWFTRRRRWPKPFFRRRECFWP